MPEETEAPAASTESWLIPRLVCVAIALATLPTGLYLSQHAIDNNDPSAELGGILLMAIGTACGLFAVAPLARFVLAHTSKHSRRRSSRVRPVVLAVVPVVMFTYYAALWLVRLYAGVFNSRPVDYICAALLAAFWCFGSWVVIRECREDLASLAGRKDTPPPPEPR